MGSNKERKFYRKDTLCQREKSLLAQEQKQIEPVLQKAIIVAPIHMPQERLAIMPIPYQAENSFYKL